LLECVLEEQADLASNFIRRLKLGSKAESDHLPRGGHRNGHENGILPTNRYSTVRGVSADGELQRGEVLRPAERSGLPDLNRTGRGDLGLSAGGASREGVAGGGPVHGCAVRPISPLEGVDVRNVGVGVFLGETILINPSTSGHCDWGRCGAT